MARPIRMKLALLSVGTLLLAAASCTFTPRDQPWYIGMSREQVFETLGNADHVFYYSTTYTPGIDNDVDAYFVYYDIHLSFLITGSSVREITILSGGTEWRFDNGLRVGLTRSEALAILGGGYSYFPNDIKDFYQYSSFGLTLEVIKDTDVVAEIAITSNALHWYLQGSLPLPPDQPNYIGMSRQQVFAALGNADHISSGSTTYTPGIDNDADAWFTYDDVHLSFLITGASVQEITILSGGTEWSFDNGLRPGLTRPEAIAILGGGCSYSSGAISDVYQYSSFGLTLEVINATDLVSSITITSNDLHWDLQSCPTTLPDQSYYVGMSRQQVFDALGDADVIFYGSTTYMPGVDNDVDAYFMYNDAHLSFRIFGPSVLEITIRSAGTEWGFDNGLRVGLTRAEALAILGGGYYYFPHDLKDFYQYSSLGLSLEVLNSTNLVAEMNVTSNALHWDLQ